MTDRSNKLIRNSSEHLKNIFASSELGEDSVIRKFRITAADGKSYANGCRVHKTAVGTVDVNVSYDRKVAFSYFHATTCSRPQLPSPSRTALYPRHIFSF